ncbi:MAG: ABC transporter ATP-binding protein [Rhodobacterales bacterium]|jgi:branched-chain amino acid transport system ATP-binding protein|nr:ABC transporter ATP-binding protein [Rhodobacterales bacterium]|tara:strand:- start:2001 stop:2717 length:717 start_codon:yes stop_codon:yes gene_type:complete
MDSLNNILLYTENLTKNFQGIKAVNDINFKINHNEIRALIGPNGAGKTTFVSLLCGRIKASKGKVFFNGVNISHLPVYTRISMGIGYTFQITSIFFNLTVSENVALALKNKRQEEKKSIVSEVLNKVGLIDRINQRSGDLSYGHQRLLELAMGIAQRPKLLILDEPTQGLSDLEIENFKKLIKKISATVTVLLIEHNMDVVMSIADKITVLHFGEIIAEGDKKSIQRNPVVQKAYLGD